MKQVDFRRLKRHKVGGTGDRMLLSYPLRGSPSGKQYQYSPNPDAVPRVFLIGDRPENYVITPENRARIRRDPGPGETVCPYSGYVSVDEDFIHPSDRKANRDQVRHDMIADIQDHLKDWVRDFNRKQPRDGFVTMSMRHKPGRNPRPSVSIREDLLRDLQCGICGRSYGVYAIALFCPDCGAPNIGVHYSRERQLVLKQIALADAHSATGEKELAYRLMGNAHEDVLTAFETTLKTVFRYLRRFTGAASTIDIGNSFQNIVRARRLFSQVGVDPFADLGVSDLTVMAHNIQKRHVIGHNLGIADERYVRLTQQSSEETGESVQLLGDEIRKFCDICGLVVQVMDDALIPSEDRSGNVSS